MDTVLQEDFFLDAKSIERAIEETDKILEGVSIDSKDALRLKLSLEEILLKYKDEMPEKTPFSLRFATFFGAFRVLLRINGKMFDPLVKDTSTISVLGSLMAHADTMEMAWHYRSGINLVTFTIAKKQKLSFALHLLLGIAAGIFAGYLIRFVAPGVAPDIAEKVLNPLTNSFTGLLCVMATLMCFGAISLGIVRMGDISTFSTVGKKMIRSFLVVSLVLTLLNTAWLVPGMRFGMHSIVALDLFDFWKLILGFIPSNVLNPILEFNSVHIVIIGIMFGIAMLKMGKNANELTTVFDQVNTVAIMSNGYLNRFIPVYVGCMICSQILTNQRHLAQDFAQLFLIVFIGEAITLIVYTLIVSFRLKVRVSVLVKKLFSAFIISLSTASVSAAFFTTIDTLIGKLGIEENYAPLAYNLGGVLFRPGYCIVFTACSLLTANHVGIEVTWAWIFAAFFLSFVLSVATPPVIGGTAVCFSILFSQLGLGSDSLALIISINAILEFLTVAVNNYCLQCQIALLANSCNKINLETLRDV